MFATQGRDASTFKRFADDLKAQGGDPAAITDISTDVAGGFLAGAKAQCPQARISLDPFHVHQLAHVAVDEVRRAESKREPRLRGSRWSLLKSAEKWTYTQQTLMHHLQCSGVKTARVWRMKEALRRIFKDARNREQTEPMLRAWISWARRRRLPAFKRLGQTLRTHLQGILGHFESGLNKGFLEAMNGLIQGAKARARGYRTDRRLILMSYLVCGKLKHLPGNPWTAAAKAS